MSSAPETQRDAVPAPARGHYRPHLDGLRCVAVYLVVAFHAGLLGFGGGFIGVDVFFVLSGFLVTGILTRDLTGGGRVDLRRFYARRFRRILPAAVTALVVVAFVYSRVVSPAEMSAVIGGFKASFLFVANWYFIRQAVDYFATSIDKSPVLHFWSLAVEEQFYLVWPLLFGGLFAVTARLGRYRWWALRAIVGGLAILSLVTALRVGAHDLNRAYYGTDTRAYQLLAGALLALAPQLMHLGRRLTVVFRMAVPIALGALVLFSSAVISLSPITRGTAAVVITLVLIVGLENGRDTPFARWLASPTISYLGRVSFATYLWHWPIVVIATHDRQISPVPLFILSAVMSTGLAIASYHLLEQPIRGSSWLDRYRLRVIASGLAVSLAGAFLIVPGIADRQATVTTAAIGPAGTRIVLDWRAAKKDIPDLPDCLGKPLDLCRVVKGTGKTILLAGDSNARMWIPTFAKIARANKMSLYVSSASGCPWQRGLRLDIAGGEQAPAMVTCVKHQNDMFNRMLPQLKPGIVALVDVAYDDPLAGRKMITPGGLHIKPGDANFVRELSAASRSSLVALRAPKREVAIVEPLPVAPTGFDPLSCLSTGKAVEKCAFTTVPGPTGLEQFYRSVADGVSLVSIDADRLSCPKLPRCDAVVDGLIVKRDPTHLTATYAAHVAPKMSALLVKNGVLPAAP